MSIHFSDTCTEEDYKKHEIHGGGDLKVLTLLAKGKMVSSSISTSTCSSWKESVIMDLVAEHLDPKTLAIASCVSKSWFNIMSSDQVWKPICFSHYPSLFSLHHHPTVTTVIPYSRLFVLGLIASKRRRCLRNPIRPSITMDQLIFVVDIFNGENSDHTIFTLVKNGDHLMMDNTNYLDDSVDGGGLFRFDVDVSGLGKVEMKCEEMKMMRVTWCIVLKEWRGMFMVMDCNGEEGMSVIEGERWFSEDLPSPGGCWCCCSCGVASGRKRSWSASTTRGVTGEIGLGFHEGDGGRKRLDKVSIGFSVVGWRYMSVGDAILYLQHFLVPVVM